MALRDALIEFERRRGGDISIPPLVVTTKDCEPAQRASVFLHYRDAANSGIPFAMCMCARLSRMGWGTEKSDSECFRWASLAAAHQYAPGFYELGLCYEKGIGAAPDLTKSAELYKRSADDGFGFAAERLGRGFMAGELGPRDFSKAVFYMERACELGESSAAYGLGEWFESGEGVSRDTSAAVRWYSRASDLGNFFASHRLHIAYLTGELDLPRDPARARHYEELTRAQTTVGDEVAR